MARWTVGTVIAAVVASMVGVLLMLGAGPALGQPASGSAEGQNPSPFVGVAPFGPPRVAPVNGSTVGVAQPIIIDFPGLVDNSVAAENAVHVSSVPPAPGKFY